MRNTGQSRVGLGWHCVHAFSFVYLLCLCCPEEEKLACKMRLAMKTIIDASLHPLLNYCTAALLHFSIRDYLNADLISNL